MSDPSLVLDKRAELGAAPGMHVIIIGVSEYAYLPGADDPAGQGLTALKKLQSSALSGWLLAEKLKALDKDKRLKRPLKTMRLMLAPSQLELNNEPLLATAGGELPTCDAIRKALRMWRKDVAKGKEEQALFLFSGHGIRRQREDTILLAADFLEPDEPMLDNCFNFRNIKNGMVPVPDTDYADVGREQFYFIDACRDKPDKLDTLEDTNTPLVFDAVLGGYDDRLAPVYYPTATGGLAAGIPGKPTFFIEALLWALDHASHDKLEIQGVDGEVWQVTAESLKDGFEAANPMFKDRIVLGEMAGDPMLCFGWETPRLKVTLALRPDTIDGKISRVLLCELQSTSQNEIVRAAATDPWTSEVSAGYYTVQVEGIDGAFPKFNSSMKFIRVGLPMPWAVTVGGVS